MPEMLKDLLEHVISSVQLSSSSASKPSSPEKSDDSARNVGLISFVKDPLLISLGR